MQQAHPTMQIPAAVQHLLATLTERGYLAYAVGGCVRDSLIRHTPSDWDITTSADPQSILATFWNLRTIETGIAHGTVTVIIDGTAYEVTTFRADGEYADHRHPSNVQFVPDLASDLARRDFTVNAMALTADGELIDLFGGTQDINNRIIRCVGDPEQRFDEDALRILRALRFASVLGFTVDEPTRAALMDKSGTLRYVSRERVYQELIKLLMGDNVLPILLDYHAVLGEIIPEILPTVGLNQHNPHHKYDVWAHIAHSVALAPKDIVIRLTMLLHDLGKPRCHTRGADGTGHFYGHARFSTEIAERALAGLRVDKRTHQRVVQLIKYHDIRPEPTAPWLTRRLSALGEQGLRDLFKVQRADASAQSEYKRHEKLQNLNECEALLAELVESGVCYKVSSLEINGDDLIALGFQKGKPIGEALNRLLSKVMSGKLPNEREALLEAARKMNR